MKKHSFLFFGFLMLICLLPAYSQVNLDESHVKFQSISLKDGLSHSTVYDIKQDKLGYLWAATADGLNRYDGYKFLVFQHNPDDSLSIPSNYTTSLMFDKNGDLWVGTGAGLVRYNYMQNSFTNFGYLKNGSKMRVFCMEKWTDELFIVATNLGLFSFSEKSGFKLLNFPSMSFGKTAIIKVDNKLLIGANRGLYFYYPQSNTYSLANDQFKGTSVMAMVQQGKNKIWVGTEGFGLYLFDLQNNTLKQYKYDKNNPRSISSNFVRSLCYDNFGRLWVGSLIGLNVLNKNGQEFTRFYNNIQDNGTISNNSIRSIYLDNQNGLWFGTFYGGLNYYHPLRTQFEHIYYVKGDNSLNDNVVSCILADTDDRVWIGTNDKGLDLYNIKTKKFEHFRNQGNNPYSLSGNFVKTILKVDNSTLLVGTHGGGLDYFNIRSRRFTHVFLSNDPMINENVYGLAKDSNGMIWVGTLNGLMCYNPSQKKSTPLENMVPVSKEMNQKIMGLFIDSKERLWIGTDNGVWLYYIKTNKLQQIHFAEKAESEKTVFCFYEQKSGQIWVGTSEGICFLNNNKLISYKKELGFPRYHICSIQEDHFKQLWVSTNRGLICFSPDSDKWRIYTESDGMQSNQFNDYASCKTADDKMFFGGINGITVFAPEKLIDNPYSPSPIIENLSVFNKVVTPNDNTGILSQIIEHTKSIQLKPHYNLFELEFVVSNFLAGKKNTYAYILEGFDDNWYTTEKNSVSYSNLSPGKYLFKVKAANNNGKWSPKETKLEIVVLPYWYNTWWAKTLFLILIIILVYYFVRFLISRKLIAHELELERKDKERIKELDEAKIRFFVNVSHEFRTPLTLILSPVREMLSKGVKEQWVKKQLTLVERNTERMLHLINQVLDYRKSELGAMPLQVRLEEVEVFAGNCFDLFLSMAKSKNFNYIFNSMVGDTKVYYDRNFLERILSNLLGNAFKFTPNGGSIELDLSIKDKHLYVKVIDTGAGIAKDKIESVFDRFYQQDKNEQGTGIGLSLVKNLVDAHHGKITLESELGKGSAFTVILPAEKEFYTENEIICSDVNQSSPELDSTETDGNSSTQKENIFLKNQDEEQTDKKQRILVVEDDEEIRNYLFEQLSEKYEVVTADNGKNGWELLIQKEINLILCDIMMPVLDGISLCKLVKQNINYSHIPFILLTAKNDLNDQLKGLQFGADDYIGKPFVYSILETKIANIFKQHIRIITKYASSPEINLHELVTNQLDEEFLNKAVIVVEKYLSDSEFSVEEFSREMFMSRSSLHLKIKAITGEATGDFIRKVRLSAACKLLKEGRYNVTEISTMIGMSPTYFSTSFKKHVGCLPSEYLKKTNIIQG